MPKVLVIGDSHVDEKQSLDRFNALGNKIVEDRPEYIIIMGDFLSMNCLSDWDKNKRRVMENQRYKLELDAGNDALDRLFAPLLALQERQRRSKHSQYTPIIVYLEGNHENRVDRYLDVEPVMEGQIGIYKDLYLEDRGIEYIKYKDHYEINGVLFTHIPIQANGKAIGNPNVAQKALKLYNGSIVFAHTHTLDTAGEHRHGAAHLNQALCAGCFFEHVDEYAKGSRTDYWRGVIELNIYGPNRFDFKTTSMSQLKQGFLGKDVPGNKGA